MTEAIPPTARPAGGGALPSGTVTFVFTDIEGSTRLLQELGDAYLELLDEHRQRLMGAFAAEGGRLVNTEGDALFVVFASPERAVAGCVRAQRALLAPGWEGSGRVRVRIGVHTGAGVVAAGDYVGLDVHRAARVAAAAHGCQIIVSEATGSLVRDALPPGIALRDLGVHRLRDLPTPEVLWQVVADGLPDRFPPPRTLDLIPNNLPPQITSFVGREAHVARVEGLVSAHRLVTLTGPGGTGKSRLAVEVAGRIAPRFAHGAWWVNLAPVTDPELVASAIAAAIGIQDIGGRPVLDRVTDWLADKEALLVLDGFEQVVRGAPVIGQLLRAAPRTRSLVTSRAVLRVYGEQEYELPPLDLPASADATDPERLARTEAVRLFIERATTARPDFRLSAENGPAVARIVARLDGLPLAIELAAARVKLLPPQAMLQRLSNRLSLLDGGASARDLPQRQRTLRGAIGWSHDLLDPPLRLLFARLGVFVGGCDLDAATAVCDTDGALGIDVLDGVSALVDQSLVRQEAGEGEPRFVMLETIREYALERLAEVDPEGATARAHASHFLAVAEAASPHLTTAAATPFLDRLARDHDNLRAAIGWAAGRARAGAPDAREATDLWWRLAFALWRFWQIRGHLVEGSRRVEEALALPAHAGSPAARAKLLEAAGGIRYWRGDLPGAGEHYEEALTIWRALGDEREIANALYDRAFPFLIARSDLPRAGELFDEARAIAERLGDQRLLALILFGVGSVEYYSDEGGRGLETFQRGARLAEALGDRFNQAWSLHMAGLAADKVGDRRRARTLWDEAMRLFAETRDTTGIAILLTDFALVALWDGDRERALRLRGAARAVERESGADLAVILLDVEVALGQELPLPRDAEEQRIWDEGAAMDQEQAIGYALSGTGA